MIKLTDKFFIDFDDCNYKLLQEKTKTNRTTKKVEVYLDNVGNYGRIRPLMKGILEHVTKLKGSDVETLQQLCDYIESFGEEITPQLSSEFDKLRADLDKEKKSKQKPRGKQKKK